MAERPQRLHEERVARVVESPSGAATSALAASWCRSALHHHLDPGAAQPRAIVDVATLNALRDANGVLLEVARPVLDQLFGTVGLAGCAVLLSDAQGVILEGRTGEADRAMFAAAGLTPGGVWGEAEEGTNGIGTCLVEGRPVTILRDQHFASRNIGINCMDAPVYDATGRLIAALDVSSCRADHDAAMASLVTSVTRGAAQRIERDLFHRAYAGTRILVPHETEATGAALIAVDVDDILVGANRAARLRYGVEDAALGRVTAAEMLGEGGAPRFADGERAVLRQALAHAGGNASKAARLLGIGRATFYRRMERAGLRG